MPRYKVTLTEEEQKELKELIQKGGKGYRIKHAHILLKLNAEKSFGNLPLLMPESSLPSSIQL